MPEYWFKYGVTEVSMEVPEEISQRKIDVKEAEIAENIWRELRSFAHEVGRDAGTGQVTILYDHVEEDLSLSILRHVIDSLIDEGRKVTLLTSHWRLPPKAGAEHVKDCLKRHSIPVKAIEVKESEKVSFHGIAVSKEFLEASARIIITTSEVHGILGKASFEEALALGGLFDIEFGDDVKETVKDVYEKASSETPFNVITQLNGRICFGEAEKVRREVSKILEEELVVPVEDAEVIIAGGGGYPRDSTLQSILHLIGLLRESVIEGGLIGIIAECREGLGSREFLEALLRGGGRGLDREAIELVKDVMENRRIAFTSTLPKTILKDLLNIRGFDVPQELLTYGLRLYGKGLRLLILDRPVVKPIRERRSGQS
ncbi:MAG: hypothetical protein J7K49_03220 [Thaumarchaeota archaeon]|nr:hypothetical protein [Nitrososphaerota archaeon]